MCEVDVTPGAYIFLFRLLHKESFSIVTQLHVKIHCLTIDFYINLREKQSMI